MMAALWQDVLADLASARTNFGEAVALFDSEAFAPSGEPDFMHRMAFQHGMQVAYTSFEAALKRLFSLLDEPLPKGADWHSTLLRRASSPLPGSRPAILGGEFARAADELMRFRHVAMHVYDRFDMEKAAIAVRFAKTFLARVDDEIAKFRAVIDPPDG